VVQVIVLDAAHPCIDISPFVCSKKRGLVFKPVATAIHTFDTPIQQIVSSNSSLDPQIGINQKSGLLQHSPLFILFYIYPIDHLAIRTFGSTSVLEVKPKPQSIPTFQLTELAKIVSSVIGNRPVLDIKLSPATSDGGVLVNEIGDVYKYDIAGGRNTLSICSLLTYDPEVYLFLSVGECTKALGHQSTPPYSLSGD
jgi:hypothetical protein